MNRFDYYKMVFNELELSDSIEAAREELKTYLENENFVVRLKVPIKGTNHNYDLIAYDIENEVRLAVFIGRHSARRLRLNELKQFDGDKVYLLRGNARIDAEEREGINIISVMSKGSL